MMKRVAINTRFLLANKLEGFGWFTFYVARYLVENNPDVQFYFLFDRQFDDRFVFAKNVTPVVLFPQARHPLLFKWWFNFSVTRFLRKNQIDLFVSPDGYLSLKTDVNQIAVIHDLNFEHYPEDLKPHHAKYLRSYFPKFAEKACEIITVSEFSKRDILSTYGISEEKIHVAYNGVNDAYCVDNLTNASIQFPYFLFVGAIHPRKNLKRLLLAFDSFKARVQSDHRLLIIGEPYYWSDEMKSTFSNMVNKSSVDFKPYATVDELKGIYQQAEALMFISYFEGFGIPVVEAMACGCPVVVGKSTACEEIAGDAGIKVDPFLVEDICEAMVTIMSNSELRNSLVDKGLSRSKLFSWENTGAVVNRVMHRYIA